MNNNEVILDSLVNLYCFSNKQNVCDQIAAVIFGENPPSAERLLAVVPEDFSAFLSAAGESLPDHLNLRVNASPFVDDIFVEGRSGFTGAMSIIVSVAMISPAGIIAHSNFAANIYVSDNSVTLNILAPSGVPPCASSLT